MTTIKGGFFALFRERYEIQRQISHCIFRETALPSEQSRLKASKRYAKIIISIFAFIHIVALYGNTILLIRLGRA